MTKIQLLLAALLPLVCAAQTPQPPKTATPTKKLLWEWNDIARKVNALAEEFPEAKYDFSPAPEVRTFARQLLHIAFWNQVVEKASRGEKVETKLNELPRSEYKTKAAVAAAVRDSFSRVTDLLKAQSSQDTLKELTRWANFLEHNGEHYGQLVIYYRLNGLVPPESRPR